MSVEKYAFLLLLSIDSYIPDQFMKIIIRYKSMPGYKTHHGFLAIGTASAYSAKFRGIRPRMYIEHLFL